MTVIETLKNVLNNSLFPDDQRSPDIYLIEQNEELKDSNCIRWGHIGLFDDAWGSDNKMIIDWYGFHLVFEVG